ncbi:hypothetical protein [Priestia megaterium]|uniref:hypothetical protein n=1 Tax=Priestia megaterium TaxID=1404 RepID=UPI0022204338|nr:hypothetical protein OHU75_26770 [Priestia megaterium]
MSIISLMYTLIIKICLLERLGEEDDYSLSQVKNFVEACKGNTELVVEPEEAIQVSVIIDKIYRTGGN